METTKKHRRQHCQIAVNRESKGCFLLHTPGQQQREYAGTSEKKNMLKMMWDRVFFDYIGKYRFKTNILNDNGNRV
jgi:hypothetical protein